LPQAIEAVHGVLELLPELVHDGGPSPVRRRTGSAAGEAPVGGVGAVEGLELDPDELGLLEGEGDVGVHAGAEVLDGLGVVLGEALPVGALEGLVEAVHLLELVLDGLHVLEELVEVDAGGGHLDYMVVPGGLLASEAREARVGAGREEVVHLSSSSSSSSSLVPGKSVGNGGVLEHLL